MVRPIFCSIYSPLAGSLAVGNTENVFHDSTDHDIPYAQQHLAIVSAAIRAFPENNEVSNQGGYEWSYVTGGIMETATHSMKLTAKLETNDTTLRRPI
jgi:hypothetical protein